MSTSTLFTRAVHLQNELTATVRTINASFDSKFEGGVFLTYAPGDGWVLCVDCAGQGNNHYAVTDGVQLEKVLSLRKRDALQYIFNNLAAL